MITAALKTFTFCHYTRFNTQNKDNIYFCLWIYKKIYIAAIYIQLWFKWIHLFPHCCEKARWFVLYTEKGECQHHKLLFIHIYLFSKALLIYHSFSIAIVFSTFLVKFQFTIPFHTFMIVSTQKFMMKLIKWQLKFYTLCTFLWVFCWWLARFGLYLNFLIFIAF